MRALLYVLFVFTVCSLKAQKHNLEFKILNTNIHDGEFVNIVFKNNTKYNYCFVIDTLFYSKDQFSYDGNFHNPIVFLCDNRGKNVPMILEIKDHGFHNDSINLKLNSKKGNFLSKKSDTLLVDENKMYSNLFKNGFVNTLTIFEIESGKSLQLKIPFNLVIKYLKNNIHKYYEIDRLKQYKGQMVYLINREYIEKYISKEKINALEKKGFKFFTGSLASNKVPLILK
nr:hypothetical protein [uncultured Flavobacterium sp.]